MRVPLGKGEWYLCDWTDQPGFEYVELGGDAERSLLWLSQFRGDTFVLGALRRLFDRSLLYDDSEILRQTACRLAGGAWRARRPVWEPLHTGAAVPGENTVAFPLEERQPAAASKPSSMPEPAVFPADIDPVAIAEAQKQAAKAGIPFCEECQKAQAARQ
jgi:hypothetical protein